MHYHHKLGSNSSCLGNRQSLDLRRDLSRCRRSDQKLYKRELVSGAQYWMGRDEFKHTGHGGGRGLSGCCGGGLDSMLDFSMTGLAWTYSRSHRGDRYCSGGCCRD